MVDKKILFETCLGDSIISLGEKLLKIRYDNFENFLIKRNVMINMKLICVNGTRVLVNDFTHYNIPRVYDEGRWRWYLFWRNFKKKSN